ncbi:hypothetical protein, variant [Aphanomyces astaci]|uniref:Uncharacterized protein n=1 Tax=Aphanomyces astaci TaxID=112090 RepID=W4FFX9_APHAT|nr:hypothetical protein, variant [Aphanomyces astaci]ETV65633.1 hypothetical protein, variant [Aphanomyces astaci]|eukprot:XP_009844872.1 hypothetical protein, variant [Aphanomyces astaci]
MQPCTYTLDTCQAFHRLIPLPALSSGITRLLCDEDLQVPDDDVDCTSSTAATPSMKKRTSHVETMRQLREPPTKPRQETDLTKLTTRRQPEQLRPESS